MQGCIVIYMNTTTDTQTTITLYATGTNGYRTTWTGMVNGNEATFESRGDAFGAHPATVAANLSEVVKADVTIERTASFCGGKGCVKATITRN